VRAGSRPRAAGRRRARPRLHEHLGPARDRALFATIAFAVALGITRALTTVLHEEGAGADGGIVIGGVHVHHLVFGIAGLLGVGYVWLLQRGLDHEHHRRASRLAAVVYGASAALVLDEFALWLNLRDVYWQRQGRESLEVAAAFGAVLLASVLVAPFVIAVRDHRRRSR
jgi:hypothetical protein